MIDMSFFQNSSVPFWTAVAALAAVGTACVTSVYTYLTLKLFRAHAEPKVILYTAADRNRFAIINLVVENIGNDIAFDIRFNASKPLPNKAFGYLTDSSRSVELMKDGMLVDGIPSLEPGGKRVITWGQYGGLSRALEGGSISVEITYQHGRRLLSSSSFLEVESYANNDGSELPLVKIANELSEIKNTMKIIAQRLSPVVVKSTDQKGKDSLPE